MAAADDTPLVSVLLMTKDRPQFFRVALECYRQQTYRNRELIVVDDGLEYPVDADLVEAVGGRLVRVPHDTLLGAKLNRGACEGRGTLFQKMDDDDWYAPHFMQTMVDRMLGSRTAICRPTVAFLLQFLFFDVATWEIRESVGNNVPGATLLFTRDAWEETPFRAVGNDEDNWFLRDLLEVGAVLLPVRGIDTFLAVRHGGGGGNRGHTWVTQATGQMVEDYLKSRPLHENRPEDVLPEWAVEVYRSINHDLAHGTASPLDGR